MSQQKLTPAETQLLQESINSETKTIDIRLRKGEYQYDLAEGIASFQLQLQLPDVKDLTQKLYGEKRANEDQFIRKIQTILKKMEKSNVIKILPKKRPWELQRYALSAFKFEDVDKNLVQLATSQQIKEAQNLLNSLPSPPKRLTPKPSYTNIETLIITFIIVTSYTAVLWSLLQPVINPIIFVPAFSTAVACSIILGKLLSQE